MSLKDNLSAFCQSISDDINKRISLSSDDSESNVLLYTYKEKCKAVLTEVNGKDEKTWKDDVPKILRNISQLVLDVTYVQEVQLVEDDFPQESESDIKYIIETLTSLEVLSKTVCPEQDVLTCLGPEIVECLRWRKGALLYMFCHTVHYRNPDNGIPNFQRHYLEEGVNYLVSMLKTRYNAKWMDSSSECQTYDSGDTLQLIEQGIFSDTHLLALMYCGEMCFWYTSCDQSLTRPEGAEGETKTTVKKDNLKSDSDLNTGKTKDMKGSNATKTACDNAVSATGSICNSKGQNDVIKSGDSSAHTDTIDLCTSDSQCENTDHKEASVSKMVDIGNSCLKKYVSVAKGALASGGWHTDRAEDIISCFQKLKL